MNRRNNERMVIFEMDACFIGGISGTGKRLLVQNRLLPRTNERSPHGALKRTLTVGAETRTERPSQQQLRPSQKTSRRQETTRITMVLLRLPWHLTITALLLGAINAFQPFLPYRSNIPFFALSSATDDTIVSPFDADSDVLSNVPDVEQGPLPLTWENVELVLDGMRHFLIQDGGNVKITDIDGPVVRLELQVSH